MEKAFKYAFFTCTLAYVLAAILLIIFFAIEGINAKYIIKDLLTGLTLALSEFTWWGAFYYLALLVPWLGSSLVLVLLIYGFNGGAREGHYLVGSAYLFIILRCGWLTGGMRATSSFFYGPCLALDSDT